MTEKMNKYARALSCMVFFAACTVFWAVVCPGYLVNQEWFQLFQFTPEYFRDLALTPGGLAAWCGRLLMQFYYYPWAGGIVIAAVLTGIQLLVFSLSSDRSTLASALSFIPASVCFIFLCSREVFLTPVVSLLLCLAAARCLAGAGKTLQIIATPFVWFLFGPFALIYIVVCACNDAGFRPGALSLQLALYLACPLVFSLSGLFQFRNLLVGIYISRSLWLAPAMAWIACGATLAVIVVNSLRLPSGIVTVAFTCATCIALMIWGVRGFIDFRMENLLEYGQLAGQENWNAIILKSDSDRTSSKDVILHTNNGNDRWEINDSYTLKYSTIALAYARQGKLVDSLFVRFCPGPEGLFPKYDKDSHLKNVFVSDVYYNLAMTSQAREVMFESMETIPDKQKGPRAYTRLAYTNSIDGNLAVSDKYLNALSHTLFYSDFARKFDHSCKEVEQYRSFRYKGRQYPFNYDSLLSQLADLVKECPDNKMACQYLVCLTLLQKNLQYLNHVISLVYPADGVSFPDPLQQAVLIKLVTSESFDGKVPEYISKDNVIKGMAFINEYEKLSSMSDGKRRSAINALRKKFGDTYYFFYYLQ